MIKVSQISVFLLEMSIILLPFTAFFDLLPLLNPYAQQLAFFPLLLLTFWSICKSLFSGRIFSFPLILLYSGPLLLLISALSFIVNFSDISSSFLQGRTGFSLFINNYIQLFFGFLIIFAFVSVAKIQGQVEFEKSVVKSIRIIILLLTIYCFFELMSYWGIATSLFDQFADIFHHDKLVGSRVIDNELNYGRIKGVTQEPSHLGIIFAIYFPFLYYYSRNNSSRLLMLGYLFVMIFTFSKTLYLILVIQCVLIFYLRGRAGFSLNIVLKILPLILVFLTLAIVTQFMFFFIDSSSLSRGTSQLAAILGWLDSGKFLLGEGLGQHGFYTYDYYLDFGAINNEFVNVLEGERWPFIQNIHVKILVELGITGLLFWFLSFYFYFTKVNKIIKGIFIVEEQSCVFGKAVIISLVGLFFAGFSYENFSFLFTWVALGIYSGYLICNIQRQQNYDI